MIKWITSKNVLILSAMVLLSFAILIFRIIRFDSLGYIFLVWNLFLAGLPFLISEYISNNRDINYPKFYILSSFWIIFLPNAPYILTDIIHLSVIAPAPSWYDTFLILSFAITGLLFGVNSLLTMYQVITERFNRMIASISITLICFMAGFGVYIGRYLRWNSWDVLQNPKGLAYDISDRVFYPLDHPRTLFVTLTVGFILTVFVFMFSNTGNSIKKG